MSYRVLKGLAIVLCYDVFVSWNAVANVKEVDLVRVWFALG